MSTVGGMHRSEQEQEGGPQSNIEIESFITFDNLSYYKHYIGLESESQRLQSSIHRPPAFINSKKLCIKIELLQQPIVKQTEKLTVQFLFDRKIALLAFGSN